MTPRLEITWLDVNDTPEQWLETVLQTPHHRLPVKDDSMEQIVGIVNTKRVLQALTQESNINLKALAQLPIFIPETLRAPEILSRLRTSESKMAVVISEHGGVEGIITIQDVLEAIVGELEAPEAIQRDDDSWLVDGLMPIAEFKPLVGLDALPDEEKYQTLAGFVIAYTGRIPAAGDKFVWNNTEFEVIDMDGNRVDKVLVCRLPEPDAESTEMEV
jgi:putative hemolysin